MSWEYSQYLYHISPQYVAEMWPPVIKHGQGIHVFDTEGQDYIDLDAGWGALGLGHCHPEIVESTQSASALLEHTTPPNQPIINLMEKLGKSLEQYGLTKFFFGTSGSESVEHALMLALSQKPASNKVVVFNRAYHGSSLSLMPLSFPDHLLSRFSKIEPVFVPTPFCYRCSFGGVPEKCKRECQQAFTAAIKKHYQDICAVLLEPVLGREAIVLPKGYLKFISDQCKSTGIPLILDEVKTGMGRCGSTFAFELENAEPDILCLGKSLSNGFPLSVVAFKENICPRDFQANYLILQTTFAGHAVACARANKVLEILKRDRIPEHAEQMGRLFVDTLKSVFKNENTVGQIRGVGLLCAIEFVLDKNLHKPSTVALFRFLSMARKCGIHLETVYRNVVVFTPPLIMSKTDIADMQNRWLKEIEK